MISFLPHTLMTGLCGPMTVNVDVLPVFEPNDFFWKNHWREGQEEKWEAFARVTRDIISSHGGFGQCELKMDDKLAYKQALR